MNRSITAIEADIAADTNACVEVEKKAKPLDGFFTPRKALRPGCELKARQKYAAELQQAQSAAYQVQQVTEAALLQRLSGGKSVYPAFAAILIAAIILAIILM